MTSKSIDIAHQLAARAAANSGYAEIESDHVLLALLQLARFTASDIKNLKLESAEAKSLADEAEELTEEFRKRGIEVPSFQESLTNWLGKGTAKFSGGKLHRTPACRQLFKHASARALNNRQTFRGVHLLEAIFLHPSTYLATLLASLNIEAPKPQRSPVVEVEEPKRHVRKEESPPPSPSPSPSPTPAKSDDLSALVKLTSTLRSLRATLLSRIFAQNHAIDAFIEGLFNAEITSQADSSRRTPRAVFLFAGPPGVGKTFLAESGAAELKRPFRRFDMSSYSVHTSAEILVGSEASYRNAHPGILTTYVEKHPTAVLLFDEIEKAHITTIHHFLQILDAGALEDSYHQRSISFRDTTIIFTTNVGRKLYDNPERSGVHSANSSFHRQTIIDALSSEINPATSEPYFPQAICSRLAAGYPVLFNHLGVTDLAKVAAAEAERTADLIASQMGKKIHLDPLVSLLLVMKEGGRTDARTLRAQSQYFVKNEIFKVARLFSSDHLAHALEEIDSFHFEVDTGTAAIEPEIAAILEPVGKPRIMLVGSDSLADLLSQTVTEVEWCHAANADSALAMLADDPPEFVLIDLWLDAERHKADLLSTMAHFDYAPPAAKGLDRGQELLRKLHERAPGLAIILLVMDSAGAASVNEELLAACIRAGGARETLVCRVEEESSSIDQFRSDLLSIAGRLAREKQAANLARERKILNFDTAPRIDKENRNLHIRLRNLRLSRAVAAGDASEIVDDVERPLTKFDDIVGADSAKDELAFFIDYLKNPRRFSALGLKPPKGILLYGPPGTGKTMLARAMAGETDLAYLAATATSFVTKWQGSGPENVRQLFERARRYAPSIVFIDEIDAIGKARSGGDVGHGEQMALNALLTELDGFTVQQADRPVFVLAATNFRVDGNEYETYTRALDPALVRRFSRSILVDLPDTAARRRYFKLRLGEGHGAKISDQALDLLAEKSIGMSIANLEQVLETAGRTAFRTGVSLSDDLLIETLDIVLKGEKKEWATELLEGTAWHEAGHTVMYWLAGWISPEVSIVARKDQGGGMRRAAEEMKKESLTYSELLADIRTSLGGRVGEILHLGEDAGLSTGAWDDLDHATSQARRIICQYGMDEAFGLGTMSELTRRPEALGTPLYREVQQRVSAILKEQEDLTRESLTRHREQLDAVAKALLKKNRLLKSDLEEIFAQK